MTRRRVDLLGLADIAAQALIARIVVATCSASAPVAVADERALDLADLIRLRLAATVLSSPERAVRAPYVRVDVRPYYERIRNE